MIFCKSYFLVWLFHPLWLWLGGGRLDGPRGDNPRWKFSRLTGKVLKAIQPSLSPARKGYLSPSVLTPVPASPRYPLVGGTHNP